MGRSRNPYIPHDGLKAMSPDQRERTDDWKEKFETYKTHLDLIQEIFGIMTRARIKILLLPIRMSRVLRLSH